MINFYTEKTHSNETSWLNHLTHPIRAFWGDGTNDWNKWEDNFAFYKDYFNIVESVKQSDVGFLPLTLNYYANNDKLKLVDKMADLMRRNGQNLYIWVDGDRLINYDNPNCFFIKYFSDSRSYNKNEIIQPGDLKEDLLIKYFDGKVKKRKKSDMPVLGFDGIAKYPALKLLGLIAKNSLNNISDKLIKKKIKPETVFPYLLKRKKLLDQLEQSPRIKTRFRLRDSFAKGTIGQNGQARKEFIDNIVNSDYIFCFRGGANYSLRFYETLCLGRIPMFINTNCKLPFDNVVDWKNVILWIHANELDFMEEKICDFHNSMTNSQFIEKQKYCRELWVKYLSKQGFIKHFHDEIKQSLLSKSFD